MIFPPSCYRQLRKTDKTTYRWKMGKRVVLRKKSNRHIEVKVYIHSLEIAKCSEETCIKYHIILFLVGLAFDGIWQERINAIL